MKCSKFQLFLSFLTLSQSLCFSQLGQINWQKTIGGTALDEANLILQSTDNSGYFVVSTSSSNIGFEKTENSYGGSDVWVVFLDNDGNVLWDKTYGGSENESPKAAVIHNNRLFILATSSSGQTGNKTAINHGSSDLWLLSLNLNGDIDWQSSYGGSDVEGAVDLKVHNGEMILLGNSYSQISGNKTENSYGQSDYWIIKINTTNGTILNQKTIGSTGLDNAVGLAIDNLGNSYILGGSETGISGLKTINGYGDADHWVVKLNSSFDLIDQSCFGGSGYENPYNGNIIILESKIYISGTTDSNNNGTITENGYGSNDAWLYSLDLNLEQEWSKLYGGTGFDSGGKIVPFSNGSFLLGFNSSSGISGNKTVANIGISDCWIILIDGSGNIVSQTAIGGNQVEFAADALLNNNNNLVITSSSDSGISGMKTEALRGVNDVWVFELNTSALLNVSENIMGHGFKVYPNPFTDEVNLNLSYLDDFQTVLISISSLDGRIVYFDEVSSGFLKLQLQDFASGTYVLSLSQGDFIYKQTVIKY